MMLILLRIKRRRGKTTRKTINQTHALTLKSAVLEQSIVRQSVARSKRNLQIRLLQNRRNGLVDSIAAKRYSNGKLISNDINVLQSLTLHPESESYPAPIPSPFLSAAKSDSDNYSEREIVCPKCKAFFTRVSCLY